MKSLAVQVAGRSCERRSLLKVADASTSDTKSPLNSRDTAFSARATGVIGTASRANVIVGSSRMDCLLLDRVVWCKDLDGNIPALIRQ